MTPFEEFLRDLDELVQTHVKKGLALKVQADRESEIARVFGHGATPKSRAKNGLEDALDLAQTTAEHHPLWGLLDHSAEVASTALENWDGKLSDTDLEEIRWHVNEIDAALWRLNQVDHARRSKEGFGNQGS